MRRILINECKQEISSFNPVLSHYEDFFIDHGQALLDYHRPVRSEVGGALSVLTQRPELQLIGGYGARGITSSGTLAAPGFARIASEFLAAVRGSLPLDGIYFSLHGALAATDIEDAEGYLIEQTRKIAGEQIPIVVSLDLHGILTSKILQHSDAVVVYHTNPHIDFFETGQRAARLLLRLLAGEIQPIQVRVRVPALVRGPELITQSGLFRSCVDRTIAFENSPQGLSGGVFIGNPFTDISDLASNVLLVANRDATAAIQEARKIAQEFWHLRAKLQQPLLSIEESIRSASSAKGRIVLVDAADATSSGAPGDSNAILTELLRTKCPRTVLLPLVDAPAVLACCNAGIGATLTIAVGGSLDKRFAPVEITGKVRLLSDGQLRSESHGEAWNSGPTAVLQSGPVTLVLTSRAVSLYDRTLFLACGQDPASFEMTVVKSPLCQPRFFNDGAELVLNIDAPGATSANLLSLGHTRCKRPLYPLDPDCPFLPEPEIFTRAQWR